MGTDTNNETNTKPSVYVYFLNGHSYKLEDHQLSFTIMSILFDYFDVLNPETDEVDIDLSNLVVFDNDKLIEVKFTDEFKCLEKTITSFESIYYSTIADFITVNLDYITAYNDVIKSHMRYYERECKNTYHIPSETYPDLFDSIADNGGVLSIDYIKDNINHMVVCENGILNTNDTLRQVIASVVIINEDNELLTHVDKNGSTKTLSICLDTTIPQTTGHLETDTITALEGVILDTLGITISPDYKLRGPLDITYVKDDNLHKTYIGLVCYLKIDTEDYISEIESLGDRVWLTTSELKAIISKRKLYDDGNRDGSIPPVLESQSKLIIDSMY